VQVGCGHRDGGPRQSKAEDVKWVNPLG